MTPTLSQNTQAILLLTAPLIAGRGAISSELLSPGEYKHLARHLRKIHHQPADFILPNAADLLRACHSVIDETRLQHLLERGFQLSQAIECWQARAMWIVSRADAEYPKRLKAKLREDAPAILYGCGDINLLDFGGLAVVGSRHVDDILIEYTMDVGRLAARSGFVLVSGGAKGIDQAAMRGAIEAGGKVIGVLADNLEKTSMNREHRNLLLDGQLVLISPCDPGAGFNVGNAMARNKLIYALADASLVVSSDIHKGGTWSGSIEQLNKFKFCPVYVRSSGEPSIGLDALLEKGALLWPNPRDRDEFLPIFNIDMKIAMTLLQLNISQPQNSDLTIHDLKSSNELTVATPDPCVHYTVQPLESKVEMDSKLIAKIDATLAINDAAPAKVIFAAVREAIKLLLINPMKDIEVAAALEVSNAQAKTWLQRLSAEGVIEKQNKLSVYTLKQAGLFDN